MIVFENVTFTFDGKTIIENFSESVASGEHVCLMGESGAGKSTLLNSLMGLTLPDAGRILIDGILLTHQQIHQIRSRIAWVPQEIHLPYDRVSEAIAALFELRVNHALRFNKVRLFSLFEQLGLESSVYERRMQELSGGERQRLMIAIALLLEKKILLLDEPTSALDPATRERMICFFQNAGLTIFSVTHDLQYAESCHRIITISKHKMPL